MKRLAIGIALLVSTFAMVGACTRPDATEETLKQQGFTDIVITGYAPFACSEGDKFQTGFRAKAINGETVQGTVCEGFLKGKTVRLD